MPTLEELLAEKARRQQQGASQSRLQQLEAERARRNPSVIEDVAKSGGAGLRSGTEMLLGMPGEVNQMTQRGMKAIAQKLFGEDMQRDLAARMPEGLKSEGFTTEDVQGGSEQMFGPNYEPQTRPGRYSKAITEQVPTALAGPGGRLAKIAQALFAGGGGEFAAEQAEGTGYEDVARMGGNMAGALAGGRIPGPAPSGREAARLAGVETLQAEGVPLTAAQRSGSTFGRYVESELGGRQYEDILDRQRSAFTEAGMRRVGEPGSMALPEDLARARARIGGEFDRLSSTTAVPFDQQLQSDLLNAAVDYQEVAPQIAPVVENLMNRMGQMSASQGGVLAGPNYKEMVTKLRELGASADVPAGQALDAFRNALDDAVERSLTGPALDEWRNARQQYANLMTTERSMTGPGVEASLGQIAPTRLRGAISGGGNGPATIAEGRSNMTDLANAGVGVGVRDMPQSGTAPRAAARLIPATLGGAAGAAVSGFDPFTGLGAAAMGSVVGPEIMGRLTMSPLGQSALSGPTEYQRALLAQMLAANSGAQR